MKLTFIELTDSIEGKFFLNCYHIVRIKRVLDDRAGGDESSFITVVNTNIKGHSYGVLETPEEIFQKIEEATGENNETV